MRLRIPCYYRHSCPLILVIGALSLLYGCDKPKIEVYTVTQERGAIDPPPSQPIDPVWTVPEGWQAGKPSSIRRGSFSVGGPEGQALDISITSFPGRVGSLLDNINRWRRQLGLDLISEAGIPSCTQPLRIADQDGILINLLSEDQGMLVAIFDYNGASWFFKLSGDRALAEQEYATFLSFLESVRLP